MTPPSSSSTGSSAATAPSGARSPCPPRSRPSRSRPRSRTACSRSWCPRWRRPSPSASRYAPAQLRSLRQAVRQALRPERPVEASGGVAGPATPPLLSKGKERAIGHSAEHPQGNGRAGPRGGGTGKRGTDMSGWLTVVVVLAVLVLVGLALSVRIVQQYEKGVLFRLGRVVGVREPGLRLIVPLIEVLRRVSLRIVTMPIQSQGIITRDNVSVDVSAVAYYRVVDATKAVVAIENVAAAINQIAQTTLRKVVGQHTLDQTLAETDRINVAIREILDGTTEAWGVVVTLVELKDIQLPETMKRAMARQAEAEREKRAKIIAAEGESLAADQLGAASDVMMAHPLALQLRNLQSLVELGVDKNTTVVFPAPLMSTIQELGSFLAREQTAVSTPPLGSPTPPAAEVPVAVGRGVNGAPAAGGSDTQRP